MERLRKRVLSHANKRVLKAKMPDAFLIRNRIFSSEKNDFRRWEAPKKKVDKMELKSYCGLPWFDERRLVTWFIRAGVATQLWEVNGKVCCHKGTPLHPI